MRLSVLVGPAHWSGKTHQLQLFAVARALAERGHDVTYVTSSLEPEAQLSPRPANLAVVTSNTVRWPAQRDVELALRCPAEPEWRVRADLVGHSCSAAEAFLLGDDGALLASLRRARFDVALVDAGCLASHLLVDALYPLPHLYFLCYPHRPPKPSSLDDSILVTAKVSQVVEPRLRALRETLGTPPKPQCASLRLGTIVGAARALHRGGPPMPATMRCVGSVLDPADQPGATEQQAARSAAISDDLAAWLERAGPAGFVLVSFGSWADAACSRMEGRDTALAAALGALGLPALWKRATAEGGAEADGVELPLGVRTEEWLPQRALVSHPKCRLLICHGGANSISEACAAGVPALVLPIALWSDQPANGEMVEELGVGICLPQFVAEPKACGASVLEGAMRRLLDDEGAGGADVGGAVPRGGDAAATSGASASGDGGVSGDPVSEPTTAELEGMKEAAMREVTQLHPVISRNWPAGQPLPPLGYYPELWSDAERFDSCCILRMRSAAHAIKVLLARVGAVDAALARRAAASVDGSGGGYARRSAALAAAMRAETAGGSGAGGGGGAVGAARLIEDVMALAQAEGHVPPRPTHSTPPSAPAPSGPEPSAGGPAEDSPEEDMNDVS